MSSDLETWLKTDEGAIADGGFTASVMRQVRWGEARRRWVLGAFGMTGLGVAVGAIVEFGGKLLAALPKAGAALPSLPNVGLPQSGEWMAAATHLSPTEGAVLGAVVLGAAIWIWQLVSGAPQE